MVSKFNKYLLVAMLLISSPVNIIYGQESSSDSDIEVTSTATPIEDVEPLPISEEPLTRTESLLHTAVQIQIYHENTEDAMQEAFDYMTEMEKIFSTNLKGSDVYRINQAAGKEFVKVDPETYTVIERAIQIGDQSDGKFDITIGSITNLWQIGSEDARIPSDEEIQVAIKKIDYTKIALNPQDVSVMLEEEGMVMELGGISKGYIGGRIVDIFKKYGITTAIINLGGNVVVMGSSPTNENGWNVGVQDPDQSRGSVVGAQRVIDGAVVTSGIYERYLEKDGEIYHHIMDPETGYPLENEISGVTVFAQTSFDGDSYSTALFLFGIEDGLAFVNQTEGIEAVFIDKDKGVHLSDGLKDTFELTNDAYHIVK